MPAPTKTSTPTATKKVIARPHIPCSAWPSPGTSQPATPKAIARASRLLFPDAVAAICVSSVISFCNRGPNQLDRFVPRLAHHPKNLRVFIRHLRAQKTGPRNVVIDAARRFFLSPHVQQQQFPFADWRGFPLHRTVVRIAGVRPYRHVWPFFRG